MVDDDDIGDLSSPQQENEEHDCERLVEFLQIKNFAYSFSHTYMAYIRRGRGMVFGLGKQKVNGFF